MPKPGFSSPYGLPPVSSVHAELLLYSENRVLCRLGDSEFDDGLGWNLDLLLRLWIEAGARLPLLLYQLTKPGQDEFAVLFDFFVREVAERIEEYSSGLLIGLGLLRQERVEVLFWSSLDSFMTAASVACKEIVPPLPHPTLSGRDDWRTLIGVTPPFVKNCTLRTNRCESPQSRVIVI